MGWAKGWRGAGKRGSYFIFRKPQTVPGLTSASGRRKGGGRVCERMGWGEL